MDAKKLSQAAATMGRKGGAVSSEAKTAAVRENGKLGGRPKLTGNYRLDIYKVVAGRDNWPVAATIYGDTEQECIDTAERKYGSNDGYHWTNPVQN